jgi:hypothetical protein
MVLPPITTEWVDCVMTSFSGFVPVAGSSGSVFVASVRSVMMRASSLAWQFLCGIQTHAAAAGKVDGRAGG